MYAEKSQRSYDRQAPGYDSDANWNGRIARQAYGRVMERLESVEFSSILDVGCGTGEMLSRIKKNGVRRAGIDISTQMVDIAGQKLGNECDLKTGDATALPWSDGTFDVVLCNYSFHHYEHPEKVLGEMRRVLKKGGRLVIGDCWMQTPLRLIMNVFIRFGNDGDYHFYSKREICGLLKKSGFTVTEWSRVNEHAMIVTATL